MLILIIECEENLCVSLAGVLENAGYQVSIALTGRRGLRFLHEQHCDLVIMDIHLEDWDGLQLIEEIRRVWPALPILVLADPEHQELVRQAVRLGAADTLLKPAPPEDILHRIEQILGSK